MKKPLLLLFYLLFTATSFAQKLTLQELTSLCDKRTWEGVNSTLSAKGWIYHDSKKGNSENYNTITWSYNKDRYSNKAQGWFYLYTYDDLPNKVSYVLLNKTAFNQIQGSLLSSGFKRIASNIEDGEVVSTYANAAYIVEVSTQKRDEDDWSDASLTAYQITLIKKAGVYDPNNGRKTNYYDSGEVMSEYTLREGELHGLFKFYYEDGQLKKQGTFTAGKEHGKFTEYDSIGNKTAEYFMANGKPHGLATIYEDGVKSVEKEFVNGVQTGKYVEYYYNKDGQLSYKFVGAMKAGEKDGKWVTLQIKNGKEEIIQTQNYLNGERHGYFEDRISEDTLELANYDHGVLNGPYKQKVRRTMYEGSTGVPGYVWLTEHEGLYNNGVMSGKWIIYDMGIKDSEGMFVDDEKDGKWLVYVSEGPQTGKVQGEVNFVKGEKHGLSKTYYITSVVDDTTGNEARRLYKNIPVQETVNYKYGLRHGTYELKDSTGILVSRGNYVEGYREGLWIESDAADESPVRTYYKGNYKKDKENGKWIAYLKEESPAYTMNFNDGVLHGEYFQWNNYGKPLEKKLFNNGSLTELVVYDSLGISQRKKYELYDEITDSYRCRFTSYTDDYILTEEYWVKKEDEIDHKYFELVFLLKTGSMSDGTKGYRDGAFTAFLPTGETLTKGTYKKDQKVGTWAYHYPDQKAVLEHDYEKGRLKGERYTTPTGQPFSGDFVYYDSESGLKEERKIRNGLRNGKTSYLDSNNKVVKKENYKEGVLK